MYKLMGSLVVCQPFFLPLLSLTPFHSSHFLPLTHSLSLPLSLSLSLSFLTLGAILQATMLRSHLGTLPVRETGKTDSCHGRRQLWNQYLCLTTLRVYNNKIIMSSHSAVVLIGYRNAHLKFDICSFNYHS